MKSKHVLLIGSLLILSIYFAFKNQPVKEVVQVKVVHDTIYKIGNFQELHDTIDDYKASLQTCLMLIKKKNFQIKSLKAQLNESTTADDSSNFDNDISVFLSKRYK